MYYSDISSAIESDDYFELLMRNTWHLAGGEGGKINTANLRVLVTFKDGREEVVTIAKDLGLNPKDGKAVIARLEKQGLKGIVSFSLK